MSRVRVRWRKFSPTAQWIIMAWFTRANDNQKSGHGGPCHKAGLLTYGLSGNSLQLCKRVSKWNDCGSSNSDRQVSKRTGYRREYPQGTHILPSRKIYPIRRNAPVQGGGDYYREHARGNSPRCAANSVAPSQNQGSPRAFAHHFLKGS